MSDRDTDRPTTDASDEPFLGRWSRLKAQARQHEASPHPESHPPRHHDVPQASAEAAPADAPVAVKLPDIEQLDQDSDYSAFLAPGVDASLRKRALRKLFSSPKFNVFDGLDTYRDDYTSFPALGTIVTADMRYHLERIAKEVVARTADAPPRTPPAAETASPTDDAPEASATLPPAPSDEGADHGPA